MPELIKLTLVKDLDRFDVDVFAAVVQTACKKQNIELENFVVGSDEGDELFLSYVVKNKPYSFFIDFRGNSHLDNEFVFPLTREPGGDSLAIEMTLAAAAMLFGDAVLIQAVDLDELSIAAAIIEEVMTDLKIPESKTASLEFFNDMRRTERLYAGTIKRDIQLC